MDLTRRYKECIEEFFSILDKETQQPVPFKFNPVQLKYYDTLLSDYQNLEGTREIVLKARQEGISSLILALFTVDFLMTPHSISICISHRKDVTELLFRKVKFFIESYCVKNSLDKKAYLKTDNKNLIENNVNGALFYIGTAGTKVGGRGGSAKNVHFSEVAFFEDTELITAEEIVTATAQQVPQGKGMIFLESTGNGEGNYYQNEWERAVRGESTYRPRFFGWQEFYSEEWVKEKRKDFPTEAKYLADYPKDPDEAFAVSGDPYFDTAVLKKLLETSNSPIRQGRITPSGEWV